MGGVCRRDDGAWDHCAGRILHAAEDATRILRERQGAP